jgi:hypothetical protein
VTESLRAGQAIVAAAVARLHAGGLSEEEIRRLFEAEMTDLAPATKPVRPGGSRG